VASGYEFHFWNSGCSLNGYLKGLLVNHSQRNFCQTNVTIKCSTILQVTRVAYYCKDIPIIRCARILELCFHTTVCLTIRHVYSLQCKIHFSEKVLIVTVRGISNI
jgi:hypothetical protein